VKQRLEFYLGSGVVLICLIYAVAIRIIVPDAPWLFLYSSYAVPIIGLAVLVAIVQAGVSITKFAWQSRGKNSPIQYVREQITKKGFVGLFQIIWPVLALIVIVPAFNVFKQCILPELGYLFDDSLASMDAAIFGVPALGLWMVERVNSSAFSGLIDMLYHAWFFPMVLGVILISYSQSLLLRQRYMLTFSLAWIIMGTIMAYLLPAAGPFYVSAMSPETTDFTRHMTLLDEHQRQFGELSALTYQTYLRKAELGATVVMGGGISAMPSMHNAFALLFALSMWCYSRVLGTLFGIYALAILLGSVYLGWHYAVDGLLAWLLIGMLWLINGWAIRGVVNRLS
jgi:hypothetical protein